MGLFGRRATPPSSPEDLPDGALAPLSVRDARLLVAEASAALRAVGYETVYDSAGALVAADGHAFGLTNLAAMLASTPRRRWRRAVTRHARTLAAAHAEPAPQDLDAVRDALLPRLATAEAFERSGGAPPRYAPTVGPGLWILAAVDYPTHVATLSGDRSLDALGGWDAVRPHAEANLRRMPTPEHRRLSADPERPDAEVHLFTSADYHGASRVLLLDELLASTLGVEVPPHGVLFAVPNRHLLAVHVLAGAGVATALPLLVRVAQAEHDGAPGPLSPFVYYRAADGTVEQVSRAGEEGSVVVDATGALGAALGRLGLLPE